MTEKLWRPIKGWEKRYEVSTHGEIRNKETGRILAQIVLSISEQVYVTYLGR